MLGLIIGLITAAVGVGTAVVQSEAARDAADKTKRAQAANAGDEAFGAKVSMFMAWPGKIPV